MIDAISKFSKEIVWPIDNALGWPSAPLHLSSRTNGTWRESAFWGEARQALQQLLEEEEEF